MPNDGVRRVARIKASGSADDDFMVAPSTGVRRGASLGWLQRPREALRLAVAFAP